MPNRVDAPVHPMQSPAAHPALRRAFRQAMLVELRERHQAVLRLSEASDRLAPPPMGRFPTICVGYRPTGGVFGLARRHGDSFAQGHARLLRSMCLLRLR